MTTLSDARFVKLRAANHTGTTNDMMLQWLQAGGATSNSLNDAWDEWLVVNGLTAGTVNDRWFEYLGLQGHTGTINDRELAFWSAP